MRPVRRGSSPIANDFNRYEDAKTDLISRISKGHLKERHLGSYCSYCERRIETNLAVEHIEPKKEAMVDQSYKEGGITFF